MMLATLMTLALNVYAQAPAAPAPAVVRPISPGRTQLPTAPPGYRAPVVPAHAAPAAHAAPVGQPGRPSGPPPVPGHPVGPAPGSVKSPVSPENAPIERDIMIACAVSRMGTGLQNAPAFYSEKADLAARVSDLARAGLRTKRAQDTLKAVSTAKDAQAKIKLWQDLAKSIGLERWQCPSIEAL